MHFWRGFFVYAAVSIAPPLILATGDRWILAIPAFAGWWIVWRLVSFVAGIHPHLDVRM